MTSIIKTLLLVIALAALVSSSLLSHPDSLRNAQLKLPRNPLELDLSLTEEIPMGPIRYVQCFAVGSSCRFDTDCPRPSEDHCTALAKTERRVIPASSICISGFCRVKDALWNDSCDCHMGCSKRHDLACVEGKCTPSKCTPCGETPKLIKCCPPGVMGHDGTCVCKVSMTYT
ncbi:hypothetical protein MGYG_01504 [Nannizzia gypsea CBS 118893]|uniref:Uncharacterized protein n=1 Tax=Arthroderma gypseum (strain ATCC MYA-4604 / CBS 118893) TaxID=535722 RepID=E5R187_ARTGP|nr:hypothetical protein MGYG_01504 [Nannizzia gypsea CBS 118893]EFQ98476.1 hypothetical protein MGYG_01504 [Nannizzia gypsea CBS 118893]